MRRISQDDADFDRKLHQALQIDESTSKEIEASVDAILAQVREGGDTALRHLVAQYDGIACDAVTDLSISKSDMALACERLSSEVNEALQHAAARIRSYHERQHEEQPTDWRFEDELGNVLGQRISPMARVGVYAPGGKASYPSTILMTAIPAKVAGVSEVVLALPADKQCIDPVLLAAAHYAGVDEFYTMGGAQAIGALAYGCQTIQRVDKICGPGNLYVATAKRRVFGEVGIDMVAGPSEVLVVADAKTRVDWVVDDVLAQAEHDELAQSIVASTDGTVLEAIREAVLHRLQSSKRKEIASASIMNRGLLIQTCDEAGTVDVINRVAPEHLELSVEDPDALMSYPLKAGAVFVGEHSPEVVGDYSAGPSHVLPTSGSARFASALGTYDFVTRQSVIQCHRSGVIPLAKSAAILAEAEGLDMHAAAAYRRIEG